MSKRDDRACLQDIRLAILRILDYVTGMSEDDFLADAKTQDAVLRNLEIIGESAKLISQEMKERYAEMPWRSMAQLRDKLIHHYFGVNLDIVWGVVQQDLPTLLAQIEEILAAE
jgi:uncharacterized protein with HEPN domain